MSAKWHPGQLIFCGFEGSSIPADLAELVREGRVGGVTLFKRNIVDPPQCRALIAELRSLAPPDAPLIVSVDQEGGRVQRFRSPWTEWPPMRKLGELDDLEITSKVGEAIADELCSLGVQLNFAPIADVDSNPNNPVIGDRSFGRDPAHVSRHVAELIRAFQKRGLAACAKHFPGHGDTDLDSHFALPKITASRDRLDRVELPPFRSAIESEVATVMSAHVVFAAIDSKRPATLSPDVMGILRKDLEYQGLVLSDDIEMDALAKHFDVKSRSVGALEAGVDVLLICSQRDLRDEVLQLLERAKDHQVENALGRLIQFKSRRWGELPPELSTDSRSSTEESHKPSNTIHTLDDFILNPSELSTPDESQRNPDPPYFDHQELVKVIQKRT